MGVNIEERLYIPVEKGARQVGQLCWVVYGVI